MPYRKFAIHILSTKIENTRIQLFLMLTMADLQSPENTMVFASVLKLLFLLLKYQILNWYEYTTYKYNSIIHLVDNSISDKQ